MTIEFDHQHTTCTEQHASGPYAGMVNPHCAECGAEIIVAALPTCPDCELRVLGDMAEHACPAKTRRLAREAAERYITARGGEAALIERVQAHEAAVIAALDSDRCTR